MKKNILVAVSSFVLGAALFIGLSGTLAANTNSNGVGLGNCQGPKMNQENREALDTAFQNNDYNTWKSIVGDNAITEKINESNFARFAEAHRIMNQAREQAQAIFDELGVKKGFGQGGKMMGGGKGPMMNEEQRTAVDAAINNGDYAAWKTAIGDSLMENGITESNFARFAEAHKLMQAGKADEAKAIFDELGIKRGNGVGKGRMGGNNQKNQ
uniref:Uncharacterized protein n=1 Tax=candidate division CPR3 bacterium TaxID=2268181 RepID=A0A7C4M0L2_UNCC3